MIDLSPADYDTALERAEQDLEELSQALDQGVADEQFATAVLLLSLRARTLFRGFTRLIHSDVPVAALALMRPTIEINLTLRFLVANPELHTGLWIAEGERQTAIIVREIEADQALFEKASHGEAVSEEWHEEKRAFVEETRAKALEAGVRGVSKSDRQPVIPSMRSIAYDHGDQATKEAYTFAYRSLSHAIHGSSRAFDLGHLESVAGGQVKFVDELAEREHEVRRHRSLNAATFASTLCISAGSLQLGCYDKVDMIRQVLTNMRVAESAGT
jgi:hypothetical protein